MQEVKHASRLALVLALAVASPALAIELGEVEPRSALGELLDARIPFRISEGTSVDASCFALVRDAADGKQMLGEGVLTVERRMGEKALRIRTLAPVMEPALTIRVRGACPGSGDGQTREYAVLLRPRAESAPAPVAAPTITASPIARLAARGGDSLESVATKVYPRDSDARARYLAGLRELNPELAALGPNEPIPEDSPVVLPDLRKLPRAAPAARARTRLAEATPPAPMAEPVPKPEPAPRKTPRAPKPAPPAAATDAAPAPAPEKRAAPAPRPTSAGGYVLKLSSSEVDLTRSRQIDDRMRAQLRERLLVLDADDQVAAMLSMRHSLKQLEARVAEMQLKLDSMPASLAARSAALPAPAVAPKVEAAAPKKAEPAPPKVEPVPPKVEPAPAKVAVAPKIEPPPKVEPPAPKPEPPRIEPPVVEAPVAKAAPTPAKAQPAPKVAVTPAAEPRPEAKPATLLPPPVDPGLPEWLWAVAAALAVAAILIGWWMWRRRNAVSIDESSMPVHEPETEIGEQSVAAAIAEEPSVASEDHIEIAEEVRPQIASDATLSTRFKENSGELRRRYIEERFPEIQNRTIVLEDAASVVKGARLFYEDGALPRAVELLQFVIEDKPSDLRPWLALFEIFRLERLTGEFAELARRFREHHGKGDYWRKVQFFGREIDPANALYREAQVNTLETIGPREAKRLAAGLSSVAVAANFDPIAENWLNAPMDFENEVLANELRMKLMAEASLTEPDLAPNPMPALRSVDMFNVA